MKKTGIFKKMLLILLSVILGAAPCVSEAGTLDVFAKAAVGTGSYADQESEVVGTWSANGNTYTNRSLLEKLPDVGSPYRFTTENSGSGQVLPFSSFVIISILRASIISGLTNCIFSNM